MFVRGHPGARGLPLGRPEALMLTDLLLTMQPRWWHLAMRVLNIPQDFFHEWLEGLCPCGAFGDNEAEYAALEEGCVHALAA